MPELIIPPRREILPRPALGPPIYATSEQEAIIDAVRSTKDNICINALAGAAKSTTLELHMGTSLESQILSLAFNKRIADEAFQAATIPRRVSHA